MVAISPEFAENLTKALDRLYDLAYLETSPLVAFLTEEGGIPRGRLLRGELVDAVESLRPPEATMDQIAWRPYRILEGRYIAGQSVEALYTELSLGRSQYYREQSRALEAITNLLWHKWELQRLPPAAGSSSDLVRDEVAQITRPGTIQRLNVMAVLRETVGLLTPLIEERPARLVLSQGSEAFVVADPTILTQCLLVPLADALVRADEGTVRVQVSAEGPTTLIEMCVEAAPAPDAGAAESRDTARALVRTLNGEIEFRDDAGCSRVLLRLPSPNASRTLLLVDNSKELASLFARYIDGQGWLLVHAETVEQAWAICTHEAPALVLLDVLMPAQDGWHLLTQLRRSPHTAEIPVVICSVLNQPELALALGASDYLRKPVTQRALLKLLTRWS